VAVVAKSKAKPTRKPARLGVIGPSDPFFWFCGGNYTLNTYPADCIPKNFHNDGSLLVYHYSDIVSRTGTPELSPGTQVSQSLHNEEGTAAGFDLDEFSSNTRGSKTDGLTVLQDNTVVPPSICLCQPTELTSRPRDRWDVDLEFVDDRGLILGDSGWFPGALGQRFCFEAKADNIDGFVCRTEVPQGQLLYIEHVKLFRTEGRAGNSHEKELWQSGSSSSAEDSDSSSSAASKYCSSPDGKNSSWNSPKLRNNVQSQRQPEREKIGNTGTVLDKKSAQKASMMLPPILSARKASLSAYSTEIL
jgi:hypothetical protein